MAEEKEEFFLGQFSSAYVQGLEIHQLRWYPHGESKPYIVFAEIRKGFLNIKGGSYSAQSGEVLLYWITRMFNEGNLAKGLLFGGGASDDVPWKDTQMSDMLESAIEELS